MSSIVRNSLYHRQKLLGSDVLLAIDALVCRDSRGLPMALDKDAVANELVVIGNTNDDGLMVPISAGSKHFTFVNYRNSLDTTSVFQAGYELYSAETKNPIVPVTSYFFNHVYCDEARDILDAMSQIEIRQSLPKRPSMPVNGNGERIHNELSGRVAGIVVFPPDSRSALLRAWLERRVNTATHQMESTVNAIAHARPDSELLPMLRQQAGQIESTVRLALPKRSA